MTRSYMLIDENDLDRFIVKKVIEQTDKYHFGIKTVSNAVDALLLIEKENDELNHTTVILLDLYMPLVNGFEFVQEFEKLPSSVCDKYLIYVLTASIDRNDISRVRSFNSVVDVIHKPLTKNKLIDVLQQMSSPL